MHIHAHMCTHICSHTERKIREKLSRGELWQRQFQNRFGLSVCLSGSYPKGIDPSRKPWSLRARSKISQPQAVLLWSLLICSRPVPYLGSWKLPPCPCDKGQTATCGTRVRLVSGSITQSKKKEKKKKDMHINSPPVLIPLSSLEINAN